MPFKLHDVLAHKKPGDKWYCMEAPQEFHMWTKTALWNPESFKNYGVSPVALHVTTGKATKPQRVTWTKKNPRLLKCGIQISKGFQIAKQTATSSVWVRVDGPTEINSALLELSREYDYSVWEVMDLQIQTDSNILIKYKKHNPDGQGASLYLYSVLVDGNEKYYFDIDIYRQKDLVGKFQDGFAACTAIKGEVVQHSCARKEKVGDIKAKLRKKKTDKMQNEGAKKDTA